VACLATCDMGVYLSKNGTHVTADMTATHAAVKQLTKMVQEHRHKLYLDNSFTTQLIQRPDKTEYQLLRAVRPKRKSEPVTKN
jgi:hypothetical protein